MRDVAAYLIVLLGGALTVLSGLLVTGPDLKGVLLSVGTSIIATAVVSFLLLIFIGNPIKEVIGSLQQSAETIDHQLKVSFASIDRKLESSFAMIGDAYRTGLIGVAVSRSDLETSAWLRRLADVSTEVMIIAYAMEFLSEHDRFIKLLGDKSRRGCKVRLLMGDPEGEAVAARNREERFEGSIRSRIETTLIRLNSVRNDNVQIRIHDTPLYCAAYIFDDEAIVTPHLYGLKGSGAPTLILRRTEQGLYEKYRKHFEDVWLTGREPNISP